MLSYSRLNFISFQGLVIKRGLELMASTLGSNFQKEEIGAGAPLLALSPPHVLLMKDLVSKFPSKIREWMEVDITSNNEVFQALLKGKRSHKFG